MKPFMFLLAAYVCPNGFSSAATADESRSVNETRSIELAADEVLQENEVTATPVDAEDVAAESEVSTITAVNSTEEPVGENVQDTAGDGAGSEPEAEVQDVPSHKRIVIRLGGSGDENSALATIVDDPQTKLHVNEKIVVIGPDGKHQEFAISGHEAGKVFKIVTGVEVTGNEDQHASHIDSIVRILKRDDASGTASDGGISGEARMAIGVQCEDVPEALRSHLDLGKKGIMIGHVREESPASEAALMKFDIIMQIGDTDVATTDDIVKSVAASDGKELTLSIIRHGQPMKVVVTPRKMEFPVLLAPAQTDLILGDSGHSEGNLASKSLSESVKKQMEGQISVQNSLRKFHPGIVIEQRMPSNEKDMQGLIEHARKLAENRGRVAQIRTQKAFEAVESGASSELAESVEALRDQVKAIEQKLEQLEKRLSAEAVDKK